MIIIILINIPFDTYLNVCFLTLIVRLHSHRLRSYMRGYFQVIKGEQSNRDDTPHIGKVSSPRVGGKGQRKEGICSVLVAKHRGQTSQYRILSANDVCLFMIIREQMQPSPTPRAPLCLLCVITTYKVWALYGRVAHSIPQKNNMWSTWNTKTVNNP